MSVKYSSNVKKKIIIIHPISKCKKYQSFCLSLFRITSTNLCSYLQTFMRHLTHTSKHHYLLNPHRTHPWLLSDLTCRKLPPDFIVWISDLWPTLVFLSSSLSEAASWFLSSMACSRVCNMPPSVVILKAAGDPDSVFRCLVPMGVTGVEPPKNRTKNTL